MRSILRGRLGRRLVPVAALAAVAALGAGEAQAQVPCGTTLTGDTTLTATDPIVTGTCVGTGLTIGETLTLDCAGHVLRGNGTGRGINVAEGVEGATIINCVVQHFNIGIRANGLGLHYVANSVSRDNTSDGVEALSDFNILNGVVAQKNAGFGFQIGGKGNDVSLGNVALENTKAGFQFAGREHFVDGNFSILNTAAGYAGSVVGSFISNNSALANTLDGFDMLGGTSLFPNDYSGNRAVQNGGNGVLVGGTPVVNFDSGGNVGLRNAGAIQCRIAGVACQ